MPWEALCRVLIRYGPVTTEPFMGEALVAAMFLWQIYNWSNTRALCK
jgi:hypothetical protein